MRILVCGGRDFTNKTRVYCQLDANHKSFRITHIIEGGATGADRLAREWAIERGVPYTTNTYGIIAGPVRNAKMLNDGQPHYVVAFPGGRKTQSMIEQANRARVPVIFG